MANRIYGLSGSGMDVDQMVKDLMKAKRAQYDKLYQKKTQLEWKKADYVDMYKSISEFRNTTFSSKLQSNLTARKTSSTNSGVTATAAADAANMTHSLEVTKLANGVQKTSSGAITSGSNKDTLANQFGMAAGNFTIQITNGDKSAAIDIDTSQSIYDVVSNINKAGIGVTANYDATLDRFFLATSGTGTKVGIDFTGSSAVGLDFVTNKLKLSAAPTITGSATSSTQTDATLQSLFGYSGTKNLQIVSGANTVNVAVSGSDTITSLVNKIKGATGANATASFSADGKFSIKSTTGTISIAGSDAEVKALFKDNLNLADTSFAAIGTNGLTSLVAVAKPDATAKLNNMFNNLAGKVDLTINNGAATKTITIDYSVDTVNTIAEKITNSGANVKATYDAATQKFTMSSTDGGTVTLSGDAVSFMKNTLKLDNADSAGFTSDTSSSTLFDDPLKTTLSSQFDLVSGGTFRFKMTNGTNIADISISTDDTMETFIKKINEAGISATASFDYSTRQFTIKSTTGTLSFSGSDSAALTFMSNKLKLNNTNEITAAGSTSSAAMWTSEADKGVTGQFTGVSGGSFTLKVNGIDVNINTATDSLTDLATDLDALANVNASYDSATGKFTLGAADGSSTLDFTGSDPAAIEFLTNKLKLNNSITQTGNDAELILDGAAIKQSSNTFTVAGVTYTLNGIVGDGDPTTKDDAASIVVTSDVDKVVENVKKFVEAYNTMLSKIYSEVNETKYKDYLPLTDEQREALSEDQIKIYEEKAKSGLLKRDPILSDIATKMRNNFSNPVMGISGKFTSASQLGMSTQLGSYLDNGKLYLDENVLRRALSEDPDAAYKILGTDGSLLTGNQKGVMSRLYDTLKSGMDKMVSQAGSSSSALYDTKSYLGKEINGFEDQMDAMKTRLQDMEERYYKQFDAMEIALNKLNQQSNWLMGQFQQS